MAQSLKNCRVDAGFQGIVQQIWTYILYQASKLMHRIHSGIGIRGLILSCLARILPNFLRPRKAVLRCATYLRTECVALMTISLHTKHISDWSEGS